jgi:hypothetical protein
VDGGRGGAAVAVLFGGRRRDLDLLVIAVTFGALGSFLRVAKSFATFAGIRELLASWIWWYCLQQLAGMGLALVLSVVVRGRFRSAGANAAEVSKYGVAGSSPTTRRRSCMKCSRPC